MAILIKDMYNFVSQECGFPQYNESIANSTTVHYILSALNQGFEKVISDLVTRTGSLIRNRQYITTSGIRKYLCDGIIQSVYIDGSQLRLIDSDDRVNAKGKPDCYYIESGVLHLSPIPNKEYNLLIKTSTKNIVLASNDTPKDFIDNINDMILLTSDMAKAVMYASKSLVLREFKQDTSITDSIYDSLLGYAIQMELKSIEAPRGNYDRTRGFDLLDNGI